jgi:hypothetical protein
MRRPLSTLTVGFLQLAKSEPAAIKVETKNIS